MEKVANLVKVHLEYDNGIILTARMDELPDLAQQSIKEFIFKGNDKWHIVKDAKKSIFAKLKGFFEI